jgi:hypothetical protein
MGFHQTVPKGSKVAVQNLLILLSIDDFKAQISLSGLN